MSERDKLCNTAGKEGNEGGKDASD